MTEFPRQRKNRLLRELDKVNISVIKYATKYGQKKCFRGKKWDNRAQTRRILKSTKTNYTRNSIGSGKNSKP